MDTLGALVSLPATTEEPVAEPDFVPSALSVARAVMVYVPAPAVAGEVTLSSAVVLVAELRVKLDGENEPLQVLGTAPFSEKVAAEQPALLLFVTTILYCSVVPVAPVRLEGDRATAGLERTQVLLSTVSEAFVDALLVTSAVSVALAVMV
jgi:hypothetical protein